MIRRTSQWILVALCAGAFMSLTACNTAEGIKADAKAAVDKVKDATSKDKAAPSPTPAPTPAPK